MQSSRCLTTPFGNTGQQQRGNTEYPIWLWTSPQQIDQPTKLELVASTSMAKQGIINEAKDLLPERHPRQSYSQVKYRPSCRACKKAPNSISFSEGKPKPDCMTTLAWGEGKEQGKSIAGRISIKVTTTDAKHVPEQSIQLKRKNVWKQSSKSPVSLQDVWEIMKPKYGWVRFSVSSQMVWESYPNAGSIWC